MARRSRKAKGPKDWTHKVESWKIFVYVAIILVLVLVMVRRIIDNMDEINEGYFNLLDVLIPLSLMVAIVGSLEVMFSTAIGAFRKDLSDRFRYLEGAKRGAISTAIVAFIIAVLVLAPPVQEMMEDASGRSISETDTELFKNFRTKDPLNLTGLRRISVSTEDNVLINVTLYRGDKLDNAIVEVNTTNVRDWEHTFDIEDVDEFIIFASPVAAPGEVTWEFIMETQVRPQLVAGIAVPFLFLGIINAIFYPVARMWSKTTEESYVQTQTRMLRARFKVEEAFLIYEDGRLIAHNSRRLKPERDKDIMTGMLTAVQSFVTDTLIDEERGTLDRLSYGSLTILVEGKREVNLATIISGEESPVLRQGMRNIVSYVSGQYRQYLQDWDGDVDRFKDVKRYIGHLVSTGGEDPVYPDELFLFHRDGRLIAHQTSRLEPSIDDAMLQQWVDQIVGAVKRTMNDPSKSMPSKLNV
ncbi:MAG: hypothetical protein GWN18_20590, partial [Thermoplasmata archaeon]|nr:hypothetical protein [Thermoplasmata archaeon]NIS14536.1 hypothetical protein [Thermoplasmata archaeon]NIS22368.1 hypothetical protein [Thermoplasmata archaeon]NIT80275.1 hypothetical protein [Thermoplasmata archaeon]NIU51377.1 hypothetical protein [Thermoplasmata archaeon]